jgi:hypothetical protein
MSLPASSAAFGPLVALDILGSLKVGDTYTVSPQTFGKIPFLSFYYIESATQAAHTSLDGLVPELREAEELLVAAHAGTIDPDHDLQWRGVYMTVSMKDTDQHPGLAVVAGFNRWVMTISWSGYLPDASFPSEASDIEIGAVQLPQKGKRAVPGASVLVYANTGRPISGSFVTPPGLASLLSNSPMPNDWYAVFNTPVDGKIKICVLHDNHAQYFDPPSNS